MGRSSSSFTWETPHMATKSIKNVGHGTLTANTVDTITFTGPPWPVVEVLNRDASAPLYFTFGPSADPTVGGDESYIVLPGSGVAMPTPVSSWDKKVKVVASAAVAYSVTGVPE